MATARGDWDLEEWAWMARWPRDRDEWRELERLALLEADGARNNPRQILDRLGLIAETARQGDRPGKRNAHAPPHRRVFPPGTFLPRNPDDAGPVGVVLVADRSISWLVVRRGGHVLARTDRVQATKRLRRVL